MNEIFDKKWISIVGEDYKPKPGEFFVNKENEVIAGEADESSEVETSIGIMTDDENFPEFPSRSEREIDGITAGELIALLQKYPAETPVQVSELNWSGATDLTGVLDNKDYGNDNDLIILEFNQAKYHN